MPSSSSYSIVEPHPCTTSSSYMTTGRGGAGNIKKVSVDLTRGSDASGPAARSSLTQSRTPFASGRGGAGNAHPPSERAIFSFDEELERELALEKHPAPVYHVGRGGAGNVTRGYDRKQGSARPSMHRDNSSGSSAKSASSMESGSQLATKNMMNGWKRVTG